MNHTHSRLLVHFTKSETALKGILKHGFYPHMSDVYMKFRQENEHKRDDDFYVWKAEPLVGFCNIKLSSINSFVETYGQFAIAISRSYAQSQDVSPVVYFEPGTPFAKSLEAKINDGFETFDGTMETMNTSLYLEMLCKNIKGRPEGKSINENYDNSAENEWMYLPFSNFYDAEDEVTAYNEIVPNSVDKRKLAKANLALRAHAFRVPPEHIEYIILPTFAHVSKFIGYLKSEFPAQLALQFMRKLVTIEQISEDF